MIRTYGQDALVTLIRSYAGGRTDDEAFNAALGLDMTAFGEAWFKDVNAKPPTKYGPQPEAPGPVPAAWASGAPGEPAASPGAPAASGGRPVATPVPGAQAPASAADECRLAGAGGPHRDRRGRRRGPHRPPAGGRGRRRVTMVRRLRAIPSWQITLGVALLALGFLIAAQLASEGPRVRYTTQERTPLVETANELQSQQDGLKDRILELRAQIQGVESQGEGSADLVRQLNAQLQEARIAAGLIALTGTGHRPPARGFQGAGPARRQRIGLPRRVARHPRGRRGAVGVGRRGDRGQRRADHPDLGDHRRRLVAAGQLRLPDAAVPGHRARTGRSCTTGSARRPGSSTSCAPGARATASASRWPNPIRSTCRPSSGRSRCATRDRSRRRRPAPSAAPSSGPGG